VISYIWKATTAKQMEIDPSVSNRIVAHLMYFSSMYRFRWHC